MTTNRLASSNAPHRVFNTVQDHIDHGNAHLAEIGRAHEVEWVILNGRPHIQWRQAPRGNLGR